LLVEYHCAGGPRWQPNPELAVLGGMILIEVVQSAGGRNPVQRRLSAQLDLVFVRLVRVVLPDN